MKLALWSCLTNISALNCLLAKAFLFTARYFFRIPGLLSNKLSSICGTFVLIVSAPRELEKLVKLYYARPHSVENWGDRLVGTGGKLYRQESAFVDKYLKGKKSCLVLASGGGRESFPLAQRGFEVTGVDCCVALVERAKEHAKALSLSCRFEIGDMFEGTPVKRKFDALFFTQSMYSTIPTRERRITFLGRARTFLGEDGFFYLEFLSDERNDWMFRIKRTLARLCVCGGGGGIRNWRSEIRMGLIISGMILPVNRNYCQNSRRLVWP